ncbi:MAG: hypothetical protein OXE96_09285 [Gemmatimonadetes bacterium]|nr:hypothetical protein [Gemmatimonadota bacterium]
MRTMAIGMALILSAVAPTTGDLGVVPAEAELQAQIHQERVIRFWGRINICWSACPGTGWCCYEL